MHRAAAALVTACLAPLVLAAPGCGARTGLPSPDITSCASFHASAELTPLDVFIMMDSSRSMTFTTAEGTSKWDAIQTALGAFLNDPDSAGIGATIAFFPIPDPNVPEQCSTDMDCGKPGACEQERICFPSASASCLTDADCAMNPGDSCLPFGLCALDPNQGCLLSGQVMCTAGTGPCNPLGFCDNHDTCVSDTYAAAAPAIATLPGAAGGILSSIASITPIGSTPTLPALTGALQRATAWAMANPSHKAIVILATDGLPTSCDPAIVLSDPSSGVPAVVKVAGDGLVSGVQTFLIGVFAPDEEAAAQANLDAIADAGGTTKAFVISTSDMVSQKLVEALDEVRRSAKACEFAIPTSGGMLPDLAHLGVRVTPLNGNPVDVTRRASVAGCDPVSGGFYYDRAINASPPPSHIILCPATCNLLNGAKDRSIEVLVSCPD